MADDATYSVLGCYPVADCGSSGGDIPGTTTIQYELQCGASSLFALAATASIAVAFSI